MTGPAYTLARWYVKEGREADFVDAWSGDLADYFLSLPGSRWGTLLQSIEDPREFYSFGPWDSLENIRDMRSDPRTQEVFGVLRELCEEMHPRVFRHVTTIGDSDQG
jgi:heme-degrading monooxygenase HmoA